MTHYLPDTNVWLACILSGHPHHEAARSWLDSVEEPDRVMLCRSMQQSVLRLLTTAAVLAPLGDPPLTNTHAWAVYDALLADPRIAHFDVEPPGTAQRWRTYSELESASPKRWMDAYLAALAVAAQHVLVTTDLAFRNYSDLDVLVLGC